MSAWGALASGIQATGNLMSSGLSSWMNYQLNERNNQMMLDQWARENNYNLPSNQVQRLLAAGLNPALIYGNGIENESAPSPALNAAKTDLNMDFNPQNLLMDKQMELLSSQAAAQDALASNYEADSLLKAQQLKESQQRIFESQTKIKHMLTDIDNMRAQITRMSVENQVDFARKLSIEKTWQQNERHINALCDNLRADKEYKSALAGITNRELWERAMSWQYRLAGLDLSNKQVQSSIGYTDAQTTSEWFRQLESFYNIDNLKVDHQIKSFQSTLLGFDVNERTLSNRFAVTDNAVANTPIGGFLLYSGHVLGKVAGPFLHQSHFGFGYNKSVLEKK